MYLFCEAIRIVSLILREWALGGILRRSTEKEGGDRIRKKFTSLMTSAHPFFCLPPFRLLLRFLRNVLIKPHACHSLLVLCSHYTMYTQFMIQGQPSNPLASASTCFLICIRLLLHSHAKSPQALAVARHQRPHPNMDRNFRKHNIFSHMFFPFLALFNQLMRSRETETISLCCLAGLHPHALMIVSIRRLTGSWKLIQQIKLQFKASQVSFDHIIHLSRKFKAAQFSPHYEFAHSKPWTQQNEARCCFISPHGPWTSFRPRTQHQAFRRPRCTHTTNARTAALPTPTSQYLLAQGITATRRMIWDSHIFKQIR